VKKHECGLPVVLVNVTCRPPGRTDDGAPKYSLPPDWTELVPELGQTTRRLHHHKATGGSVHRHILHESLRQRGVTQVVLAGVVTSLGVESTASSAYDLGYNVVLVIDAMTDRDVDAHDHSVEKVFPRLGEADTTENVLKILKNAPLY
jgi:nicotinamidase-related amidase